MSPHRFEELRRYVADWWRKDPTAAEDIIETTYLTADQRAALYAEREKNTCKT